MSIYRETALRQIVYYIPRYIVLSSLYKKYVCMYEYVRIKPQINAFMRVNLFLELLTYSNVVVAKLIKLLRIYDQPSTPSQHLNIPQIPTRVSIMRPPSYHFNSVRRIFKSGHDPDSVETLSPLSRSPNSNLRARAFGTEIPGYRAARCLLQYRFKSTTILSPIHRRKACKYLRSEVDRRRALAYDRDACR